MDEGMKPVGQGPDREPTTPEEESVEESNDLTYKQEREHAEQEQRDKE